jgi:ABC-type glycerol-3-phosphate transport system substrate-binding protein
MKGNFQIILIAVFIGLAILGMLVFSGTIKIGSDNTATTGTGTVVLWGTINAAAVNTLLDDFNKTNPAFMVKYAQKSSQTFDQDLLEALADGKGPDMIFLPDSLAFHYSNKITTIPYVTYPLANFKNTFAQAGEVFLNSKGVMAVPLLIDPLIMYYSRSMLDANSIVKPPAFWDELVAMVPTLTKKDATNKIEKSTVALGHFSNIYHAKDILVTMFMQAGSPILVEGSNGVYSPALERAQNTNYNLSQVLKFYTDFADPNNTLYSWNKSFPSSVDAFSSEDLAFYFGYTSELPTLVSRNPNQNFFVAPMPQIRGSNFKLTGARVTGIAILNSSKNPNTAYIAANQISSSDFGLKLANALGVAPARRDLLKNKGADAFSPTFYDSALFARGWLDPSPKSTDDIFRQMIDSVLSNSSNTSSAISDADSRLNLLLFK